MLDWTEKISIFHLTIEWSSAMEMSILKVIAYSPRSPGLQQKYPVPSWLLGQIVNWKQIEVLQNQNKNLNKR